jgi:hypothetical protein
MRWRSLPAALAPAVVVGALALAGCGSSTDQPSSVAGAPADTTAPGPADPTTADPAADSTGATSEPPAPVDGSSCAKVATPALFLSVLGYPVTEPKEVVSSSAVSVCTYSATFAGKRYGISLRLATAYQGTVFEQEKTSLRSEGYDVTDLPGLGTKAFSARRVTGSTANTVLDTYHGNVQVYLSGGMSIGQEMAVAGQVLAAL